MKLEIIFFSILTASCVCDIVMLNDDFNNSQHATTTNPALPRNENESEETSLPNQIPFSKNYRGKIGKLATTIRHQRYFPQPISRRIIDTIVRKSPKTLSRESRIVNVDNSQSSVPQKKASGNVAQVSNWPSNCVANPNVNVLYTPNFAAPAPSIPSPAVVEFEDEVPLIDKGIVTSIEPTSNGNGIPEDVEVLETPQPQVPLGPNSKIYIDKRTGVIKVI